MLKRKSIQVWSKILGGLLFLVGVFGLFIAPILGDRIFPSLWGVEPLAYIGALLVMLGLGVISISYLVLQALNGTPPPGDSGREVAERWGQMTQHYFELFHHDLGRPLRRILGKERELRAYFQSAEEVVDPMVTDLLDEIEGQAPNFRLMMSNVQVLIQLEAPRAAALAQPVEPSEVVRRIVDRYSSTTSGAPKEITWWTEPAEFGLVYSDSSAIEHIVTNLVDNTVRFANRHIEIRLTKNPSHFFIRVWDDGPGIGPQYLPHIFDRGWTPEVARREEKSSSGLGLFIARTLAKRYGGELTVESVPAPDPNHHTAFLLSLPLNAPLSHPNY